MVVNNDCCICLVNKSLKSILVNNVVDKYEMDSCF